MRGKGDADGVTVFACRITPAYAGKRKTARPFPGAAWDHPRLCGEKYVTIISVKAQAGSPPPMRGKVPKNVYRARSTRITPAYAGKRSTSKPKRSPQQDHPRLCGEKFSESLQTLVMIGSPPPMRGKVVETLDKALDGGITPAYAGKRSTPALW